jgi:putative transposase
MDSAGSISHSSQHGEGISILKVPLNPNREIDTAMWRYAGAARFSYNWCLNRWKELHASGKKCSAYSLQKELVQLKRKPEFEWLSEISKHIPEQAAIQVETAFKNFFRALKTGHSVGYPKFKRRDKTRPSFTFLFDYSNPLRGRRLALPVIGLVTIARRHFSNRIPENYRVTKITITWDGKRWMASILIRHPAKPKPEPPTGPSIGVDVGLTTFATISDGRKIEAPKPLRWALKKLAREQRRLSRRQNGSGRRERQRRKIARIHHRVRNIRESFLHSLTANLSKNHAQIGIETLNVSGLLKNHQLARAIIDASWYEFRRQLQYKCIRTGAVLVEHSLWFASSKTCSSCGRKASLTLSDRHWVCVCGARHDRDMNAARNLSPANGGIVRVEESEQTRSIEA